MSDLEDLEERCDVMVLEEQRILDIIEDFKKKKKTLLQEVKNKIKRSK